MIRTSKVLLTTVLLTALLASCATSNNGNLSRASQLNAELALGYLNQGDLQQAKAKVEKALQQDSRNPLANNIQGVVFQRLGDSEAAAMHLQRAVEYAPDEPEYANAYGVFLCEDRQFDAGILQFLEVAKNPLYRSPEFAYENAANCALKSGRRGIAESNLVKAIELRPRFGSAQLTLAKLRAADGRAAQAMDSLQTLERYAPSTADSLALGARIAKQLGNNDVAQSYIDKLVDSFPDSYQAKALANGG